MFGVYFFLKSCTFFEPEREKIKKNPQNPVNIVYEWPLTAIVQHLQGFLDELKFLQ